MKKPKFSVDGELHKKLNDYEITKLMNKSNMTLFLGRAGSGKSTLLISMLSSLFNNVFHKIILFCPPNSRASIKNDFWSALPEEQIYDELNYETLNEAYEIAKENADLGCKTLIILDDVQKNLKGESEKLLLEMANNRRHASLSIWLACQTYRSIPLQVRAGLTDLFIFKINKNEMHNIFEEQIELDEKIFKEILNLSFKNAHDFLYINSNSKRIFINWDEVIYSE
jgi:energy-coupling factor transporter ATP-binding protein EcfA2